MRVVPIDRTTHDCLSNDTISMLIYLLQATLCNSRVGWSNLLIFRSEMYELRHKAFNKTREWEREHLMKKEGLSFFFFIFFLKNKLVTFESSVIGGSCISGRWISHFKTSIKAADILTDTESRIKRNYPFCSSKNKTLRGSNSQTPRV